MDGSSRARVEAAFVTPAFFLVIFEFGFSFRNYRTASNAASQVVWGGAGVVAGVWAPTSRSVSMAGADPDPLGVLVSLDRPWSTIRP